MNNRKTAFLILRVEEAFKKKIIKKAKAKGRTLSDYVRSLLSKIV